MERCRIMWRRLFMRNWYEVKGIFLLWYDSRNKVIESVWYNLSCNCFEIWSNWSLDSQAEGNSLVNTRSGKINQKFTLRDRFWLGNWKTRFYSKNNQLGSSKTNCTDADFKTNFRLKSSKKSRLVSGVE